MQLRLFGPVAVVAAGTGTFLVLADAASEGDGVTRIDPRLSDLAVDDRSNLLTGIAHVLTSIGSEAVVGVLALFTVIFLIERRRVSSAIAVAVAMAGSAAMTVGIKHLVGRERPGAAIRHGPPDTTFSFPSGHTLNSAVLIGVVAMFCVPMMNDVARRTTARIGMGLLAVGIGMSRVYLGYHWATDVIGSWLLALVWVTVVVTAHRLIVARRTRSGGSQITERTITT